MSTEAGAVAGVVFVPVPGVGHLVSTVEMAKRLVGRFSVTVLSIPPLVPEAASTAAYVESVATSGLDIRISELPPVDFSVDPNNQDGFSIMSSFLSAHCSNVKVAVSRLVASPSVLGVVGIFIDFFSTPMIDVGEELGIPTYVYFTPSAACLGLMLYLPTLDVEIPSEMADVREDIYVPSFAAPVPPHAMPSSMLDKRIDGYNWFVRHGRRLRDAKGIVVNSFAELEPTAGKALSEGRCPPDHPTPPVYLVGPVISPGTVSAEHECIRWLDGQPTASVVFLCFGSMGSFDKEQLREIALGLERSGHRFLWSVRTRSKEHFSLPGMPTSARCCRRGSRRGRKGRAWCGHRGRRRSRSCPTGRSAAS